MGSNRYREGDLDLALSYFQQAIAIRSDLPNAHFGIGNVYLRRDQKSEAVEAYKKGIRSDPDNSAAHYALGALYRSLGEDSLAVAHLQAATRDSSNVTLKKEVETLLSDPDIGVR